MQVSREVALEQAWPKAYRDARKAKRILHHAIEYLRPFAIGDSIKGIAPNGEALAINTLADAMLKVWGGKI